MAKLRELTGALLLVALLAAGCRPAPWDVAALEERQPVLRGFGPRALAGATPHQLPVHGVLWAFLCRFETRAPVTVALPGDARPAERRALEAALAAWQRAGLGVRFLEVDGEEAALAIQLADEPVPSARGPATSNAVADCRVEPPEAPAERLAAELSSAVVKLSRRAPDEAGGAGRPLSAAELAGVAVQALGRALGFQGTAERRDSVLSLPADRLEPVGRRVLSGRRFDDPALAALYALPSGLVLRATRVEAWRTTLVDRMARLAAQGGLDGPFTRVDAQRARVFWRARTGVEYGLQVVRPGETLRDPAALLVLPEMRTRRALPRSRDARPR